MSKAKTPTDPLERDEMRGILSEIARDGTNNAARIAAIRQLREMDEEDARPKPGAAAAPAPAAAERPASFDELDNVAPIRPERFRAKRRAAG